MNKRINRGKIGSVKKINQRQEDPLKKCNLSKETNQKILFITQNKQKKKKVLWNKPNQTRGFILKNWLNPWIYCEKQTKNTQLWPLRARRVPGCGESNPGTRPGDRMSLGGLGAQGPSRAFSADLFSLFLFFFCLFYGFSFLSLYLLHSLYYNLI